MRKKKDEAKTEKDRADSKRQAETVAIGYLKESLRALTSTGDTLPTDLFKSPNPPYDDWRGRICEARDILAKLFDEMKSHIMEYGKRNN